MSKALLPKKKAKGAPPKQNETKFDNLQKVAPNELEGVHMKIDADKKLEMVIYGKQRKMTLTRLLLKAYEEYKINHQ